MKFYEMRGNDFAKLRLHWQIVNIQAELVREEDDHVKEDEVLEQEVGQESLMARDFLIKKLTKFTYSQHTFITQGQ